MTQRVIRDRDCEEVISFFAAQWSPDQLEPGRLPIPGV